MISYKTTMDIDLYLHLEEGYPVALYYWIEGPLREEILDASTLKAANFDRDSNDIHIASLDDLEDLDLQTPLDIPLLFIVTGEGNWYIFSIEGATLNLMLGSDQLFLAGPISYYNTFYIYHEQLSGLVPRDVTEEDQDIIDHLDDLTHIISHLQQQSEGLDLFNDVAQELYDDEELGLLFLLAPALQVRAEKSANSLAQIYR